jgi:putative transcriptional regulator
LQQSALNSIVPSLKGHFLLASPSLRDPNFVRCVVLLVRHDEQGAMGLVINNALPVSVAEALGQAIEIAGDVDETLYKGGPCNGPVMALSGYTYESSEEVLPGVSFSIDDEDVKRLMTEQASPVRYIVGYAGWGSEQLEQELAEGAWSVLPATPQDVFGPSDEDLWGKLMSRATLLKFVKPEDIPEDPSQN